MEGRWFRSSSLSISREREKEREIHVPSYRLIFFLRSCGYASISLYSKQKTFRFGHPLVFQHSCPQFPLSLSPSLPPSLPPSLSVSFTGSKMEGNRCKSVQREEVIFRKQTAEKTSSTETCSEFRFCKESDVAFLQSSVALVSRDAHLSRSSGDACHLESN